MTPFTPLSGWIPLPTGWAPADTSSPSTAVGAASTGPHFIPVPGVPGVRMLSDTVLPDRAIPFLRALRARLPDTINLDVNSGTRTAKRQASAMWEKLQAGGPEELLKVYRSRSPQIATLLSLPREAWADQIQAWADSGLYMSRHMRGGALDMAVRYPDRSLWPSSIRTQVSDAIADLIGKDPLYETAPKHLHVDLPAASQSKAEEVHYTPPTEPDAEEVPVGDPGADTGFAGIPEELTAYEILGEPPPDPDEPEDPSEEDPDYGGFRWLPAADDIEIEPKVVAAAGGGAIVLLGIAAAIGYALLADTR